jgi:hypothetical protein
MSRVTEDTITKANNRLIAGLRKHYAGKSLVINGKTWTGAQLIQVLTAEDDQITAKNAAHAAWLRAVQLLRPTIKANHQLRLALYNMLEITHGPRATVLTDFGLELRAPRKTQSGQTKLLAVEKRRATRAARNTMGPKQRKKVKGVVAPSDAHG